jgi:hypothetical protein
MKILFFFIDGIGLGKNDPAINPFARAEMPVTQNLLGGRKIVSGSAPQHTMEGSLLSIDAGLGVRGVPQSATGQAALLTGKNVPEAVGYHFGPWPNQIVVDYLQNGNLFKQFNQAGLKAALLNAYPPSYFEAVNSGRRLYSAIPQAVISAGLKLKTLGDLNTGQALSADFTAQGWRDRLNLGDTPILTPYQAGARMAELTDTYDFSFFEYWLSDYAGHHQDMDEACDLLITLDQVLDGLITNWNYSAGIVLITSDHGNMEDLSTRRHTTNRVPVLLIGAPHLRREFIKNLGDLTDVAPTILQSFNLTLD